MADELTVPRARPPGIGHQQHCAPVCVDAQGRFRRASRTPVQAREVIDAPLTLPRGVEPAPRRKLIDHPDWEIQVPTSRGIWGFILAWVVVFVLVGAVCAIVRIGA